MLKHWVQAKHTEVVFQLDYQQTVDFPSYTGLEKLGTQHISNVLYASALCIPNAHGCI